MGSAIWCLFVAILLTTFLGPNFGCNPSIRHGTHRTRPESAARNIQETWLQNLTTSEEGRDHLLHFYSEMIRSGEKQSYHNLSKICRAMCFYCHERPRDDDHEQTPTAAESDIADLSRLNADRSQRFSFESVGDACRISCFLSREPVLQKPYNFTGSCLLCFSDPEGTLERQWSCC